MNSPLHIKKETLKATCRYRALFTGSVKLATPAAHFILQDQRHTDTKIIKHKQIRFTDVSTDRWERLMCSGIYR